MKHSAPILLALALVVPGLARAQATTFTSAEFAAEAITEVGLEACSGDTSLSYSYALDQAPTATQEVEIFSSSTDDCTGTAEVLATRTQQEATVPIAVADLVATCDSLEAVEVFVCVRVTGDPEVDPADAAVVTIDTVAPAAPDTLTATGGDGVLRLSWSYTDTDPAKDLAGFVVEYRAQGEADFQTERFAGSSRDGAQLEGLTNGTTYDVQVRARDSYGNLGEPTSLVAGTPQPTDDFWELYRGMGGEETGCSSGTGAGGLALLLVLALWPWVRRRAPVALLLGAVLLPGAATAAPKEPPPRHWFVELGAGPYRPSVDDEFGGAGPYQEAFGSGSELMPRLRLERALWHGIGQAGVSFGAAFARASGYARNQDGTDSEDRTRFHMVPLELAATYRLDWAAVHWNIPLAVYGRAGLVYELWWITNNTGDIATDPQGRSGSGGRAGWTYGAGAMLLLDFFDPRLANDILRESGVDNSYLFFEWGRLLVDGFGSSGFDLSDDTWWAGLALEF